jgi:pimeloyl-ACP methyl ester carboxylesterase
MSDEASFITRRAIAAAAFAGALGSSAAAGGVAARPLHVRRVGQGSRTWVFIHPFGASGRFWEARAAALAAEHGVTILSPDLPSHGRSAIVETFGYGAAAQALSAAIAGWPAPELIVGASSGGVVALLVGSNQRGAVAAIGVGDAFSADNIQTMTRQSAVLGAGNAEFVAAFLEQGDIQQRAIMRHFAHLARMGHAPLLGAATASALADRALIINGSRDSFFLPASAHRLAASIPGSLLMFEADAEHLEPLSARFRARTWNAIEAFRRAVSA